MRVLTSDSVRTAVLLLRCLVEVIDANIFRGAPSAANSQFPIPDSLFPFPFFISRCPVSWTAPFHFPGPFHEPPHMYYVRSTVGRSIGSRFIFAASYWGATRTRSY